MTLYEAPAYFGWPHITRDGMEFIVTNHRFGTQRQFLREPTETWEEAFRRAIVEHERLDTAAGW